MIIELSEEQKQQAIAEFAHYLEMDCYDFSISVGDWDCYAGELAAPLREMIEAELYEEEE